MNNSVANCPYIIRSNCSHAVQGAATRVGDDRPDCTVPVKCQPVGYSGFGIVTTHGPYVAGGCGRYRPQDIGECVGVGAGDKAPLRAVPMLDQRLVRERVPMGADSPDVRWGDNGYSIK